VQPFTTHTGIVATLDRANVDTDAIIPKQFLKSIKRTGYGPNAFFDWRYTPDGEPNMEFELNQPRFEGRSILVTRNNFGCGSSREHAVWALVQDGYRVIIAPRKEAGGNTLPAFADIFRINATKNGLLVIELSEGQVEEIFELVRRHSGLQAAVDLGEQRIAFPGVSSKIFNFDIEAGAKHQLMEGLDDIDQTLRYEAEITRFEKNHDLFMPESP
jgi:3-isopropylmalate/(R)-2-methylmalate dehydratase small subunit